MTLTVGLMKRPTDQVAPRLFSPARVRRWRRDVFRTLTGMGIKPSPMLTAGMVLAAISGFGTDPLVLRELVGADETFLRRIVRRLRKQRVLVGQTLRVNWDDEGFAGVVAVCCDVLVATGCVARPVDPARSAAMKARTVPTRKPRQRARRKVTVLGTVWTPKHVKANPLYQWAGDTEDSQS
jgi:hypothetical protein